jgi:hypothetical protein
MSLAKLAGACVLLALTLSACGTSSKPLAGSSGVVATHAGRGKVDDPRTKHLKCLRQHHLRVTKVGQTVLQIGTPPSGPRVNFAPTPGAAQHQQIVGQIANAEVIGSAMLTPNQASDKELKTVEDCIAQGVSG